MQQYGWMLAVQWMKNSVLKYLQSRDKVKAMKIKMLKECILFWILSYVHVWFIQKNQKWADGYCFIWLILDSTIKHFLRAAWCSLNLGSL